jgi:hypothetical protein
MTDDSVRLADQSTAAVVTLGPEGTDAHAEARRRFVNVELRSSFRDTMQHAYDHDAYALLAAGFVQMSGNTLVDSWVRLHFQYHVKMELFETWHSPTKPICVAVHRRHRDRSLAELSSVALHPATEAFADMFMVGPTRAYVDAKPLAARMAAVGEADACIASVDVVERYPELCVVERFQPDMVWCLYRRRGAATIAS